MRARPYVGITGPVTKEEVNNIITEFTNAGYNLQSQHVPMLGFLVSYKTLNGQQTNNRRYPQVKDLRKLIEEAQGMVFPMIHYNSREMSTLGYQLDLIFDELYDDKLCRAVQLNIVWPEIVQLAHSKSVMPELQIVFQASHHVIDGINHKDLVKRIISYGPLIDYVLIDPSGGKGKKFNIEDSLAIYQDIRERCPNLTVGFAGGFNGSNVKNVCKELVERIGDDHFCIDAEGGLRDKITNEYGDDILNLDKVKKYVKEASLILK